MELKSFLKIFGILLLFFVWFTSAFRLWESDEDVERRIATEEIQKVYDFKILSCKYYRGYNFMGINSYGDTIRDTLSSFWNLEGLYSIGDQIVKKRGALHLLLIRKNKGDTVSVSLFYNGNEINPSNLEENTVIDNN